MTQKALVSGLLFILTIGTGVWLSNSGKPLNTLIFTIHKLIALAFVVFTFILIRSLLASAQFSMTPLLTVSVLSVLLLFITGALLSRGNPVSNFYLIIHSVTPVITLLTVALILYRLLNSTPRNMS